MRAQPFSAQVRQKSDLATIDLHGEINAFAESELNEAYALADQANPATVVLNFTDVSYINSTGIALIVSLLAQARKSRRRLVVYGLTEHYMEIFKITRLSDFMNIYPDETSMLNEIV
jgi:anti-sigma B factor antagonist